MHFSSNRSLTILFFTVLVLVAQRWPTSLHAAPNATYLFPAGSSCGQTIGVAIGGEFPTWPVHVWFDHPGVSATADADRKGHLFVSVAADAEPGVAWLRLYDDDGAASLRPFIIGTLPEQSELEPNDAPSGAQPIAADTVVNGRLQKAGDVDCFTVTLRQGETFIAALQANSVLGSPVDAVLQLCERVERRTFAGSDPIIEAYPIEQNHDAVGLDPRIVFKVPRDDVYLVRVFGYASEPDSNIGFAGGDTHVYRLTLTSGPYATAAMPLAISRGQSTHVNLIGWNLKEEHGLPLLSNKPSDPSAVDRRPIAFHRGVAGSVPLIDADQPTAIESDASPQLPQDVAVPIVLSGQVEQPRDVDAFRFSASKEQKLRVTVEASSLGSPFDPHLSIVDEQGKLLIENDDANNRKDPELVFSPPADGKYRALIRDLSHGGDPTCVYRLCIEPVRSDFALTLSTDVFKLEPGKPLEIVVAIDRRDGFDQPISVSAEGLPAGIVADNVVSQPTGESAKSVKLILNSAAALMSPTSAPFLIRGRADGRPSHLAAINPVLPFADDNSQLWLTARP